MSNSKCLVVHVKKCDIQKGIPTDGCRCAVSRAVARQKHKSVESGYIETDGEQVSVGNLCYIPSTSKDANKLQRMVRNFDDKYNIRFCRPTTIKFKVEQEENW